jgi:hypothetical protein
MSVDAIHCLIGSLFFVTWVFIGHITTRPQAEPDSIDRMP